MFFHLLDAGGEGMPLRSTPCSLCSRNQHCSSPDLLLLRASLASCWNEKHPGNFSFLDITMVSTSPWDVTVMVKKPQCKWRFPPSFPHSMLCPLPYFVISTTAEETFLILSMGNGTALEFCFKIGFKLRLCPCYGLEVLTELLVLDRLCAAFKPFSKGPRITLAGSEGASSTGCLEIECIKPGFSKSHLE